MLESGSGGHAISVKGLGGRSSSASLFSTGCSAMSALWSGTSSFGLLDELACWSFVGRQSASEDVNLGPFSQIDEGADLYASYSRPPSS